MTHADSLCQHSTAAEACDEIHQVLVLQEADGNTTNKCIVDTTSDNMSILPLHGHKENTLVVPNPHSECRLNS